MRPHLNAGDWQFLWWGRWVGFGSFGPWPEPDPARMVNLPIYSERYGLGFAELRRWDPSLR